MTRDCRIPVFVYGGCMDLADILIILGAVLLLTGLALLDWRLALAVGGLLLLLAGTARARGQVK